MTGLEAAAAAVAKTVAQRAGREWLAARAARDERSKDLTELIQVSFPDRFARRKLERQLADIADSVERRLGSLIDVEYRGLAPNDRAAVFAEATAALERADLSDVALLRADADPVKLSRRLRSGMPPMAAELGEAGAQLYAVVLDECCDCLVRIIQQLPEFGPRVAAEALARLSGLGEQISVVLERLPPRTLDAPAGTRDDRKFERRYLEYLGVTLDEIELFGVRVENYRPRAALSAAYVSLNVTAAEEAEEQAGAGPLKFATLTSSTAAQQRAAPMRAETVLARFPRTLLRGQAGSGKSTLLRWMALMAARGGFTGQLTEWNGRIPFLIKLRSHPDGPLPQPEDFVSGPLGGLMPPGWVHRVLAQGRALLLADGVDELPAARRAAVRQWLHELLAAYSSLRVIVSSRPAGAESRWLAAEGFCPVFMDPMGPSELRELIRQWHTAIRHAASLPCDPGSLPGYERALLARLEGGAHLRALAATPLLASMMCALNLDRATHLPRDRMGLYAAALELLLERRDAERGIPAHQEITLEREQKLRILQDLAYQLNIFGRAEMARATALKRIADKTVSMPRVTATPDTILEHLLQRSGVIREPAPGRIDFVHRTVQEYLAAAQAADNADVEPLIDRAHLDQWRETVIMAAGHANAPLRYQLLSGILDRADTEPRHSHRLRLLVAACLETIPDVPADLHDRIDGCVAGLIPPRNTTEARPLASAGEEVLRRLPSMLDGLPVREAIATVRTAWLINGSAALDCLARYATDPRPEVQDELVNGWSYFDPREYARHVLADAPLHHGRLDIYDPELLPAVTLLRNLGTLRVVLPGGVDLDCLQGLPALTELRANRASAASLPALAEHPELRAIFAYLNGTVADVSPFLALPRLRLLNVFPERFLPGLDFIRELPPLTQLGLKGLEDADISALTSQPYLQSLHLFDCPGLTSVQMLRHLTGLRELGLGRAGLGADGLARIAEEFPRLRLLHLGDSEWVTDLAPVAALDLKNFQAFGCPRLRDIEPIAHLAKLTYLFIFDTAVSDLAPVAGLKRLREIGLGGRAERMNLAPISGLPSLRYLRLLDVPEDTDLAPLARMRNLKITMYEGQQIQGIEHLHRSTHIIWSRRT